MAEKAAVEVVAFGRYQLEKVVVEVVGNEVEVDVRNHYSCYHCCYYYQVAASVEKVEVPFH